jgi:hypothetical protein
MQRTWYRVEMNAGPETFCVFGSSVLAEKEMCNQMNAGNIVLLEDLVYYDEEGIAKSWSDWDPHCQPRIYLNPKFLVSIMPMIGDPRTMEAGTKILNMPHFMRDPE